MFATHFQFVNWNGQLDLPDNHRTVYEHKGYDILQNGRLQGQKEVDKQIMWLERRATLWEKVGNMTASRGGKSATSWGRGTSYFLSWIKVVPILLVMLWQLCANTDCLIRKKK